MSGMRPINGAIVDVAAAILKPTFRIFLGLRIEGREHLPNTGAVLIVSNHIGTLDPPVVGVAQLPGRLYFMAKKELFRPPLGWFIQRTGAFPVARGGADREAFRTAREILTAGRRLLMFPEGTRQSSGTLGKAWPGAGSLAMIEGVTVIPTAVAKVKGRRRGHMLVRFGPPIDFSDLPDGPRGARNQAAADRMMEHIAMLLPGGANR